ncbi:uncharacterized protein [Callorhinus ursinus]|uniref:uncharacterized protein n=1 Tax=Callorhinus ursinus TaxID=34884 RepID=UPI003CD00CCE
MQGLYVGCREPSTGASAFCLREDAGAPRGWGGDPPAGLPWASCTTVGEPLGASRSQFPRGYRGASVSRFAAFLSAGPGESTLYVWTRRVSLEVGSLDACRWRTSANVEQNESPSGQAHLSHQPLGRSIPGLSTTASVIAAQGAGPLCTGTESSAPQRALSRSPASLANKVPSLQFVRHSECFLRRQIHYFLEILPEPTEHRTPGNAGAAFKVPLVARNRSLAPSSVNAMGLWPPSAEVRETRGLERGSPACILKASHRLSSPTLPGDFSITLDMRRRNKLFPPIPGRRHLGKGCDWYDCSLVLSQTSHHSRCPACGTKLGHSARVPGSVGQEHGPVSKGAGTRAKLSRQRPSTTLTRDPVLPATPAETRTACAGQEGPTPRSCCRSDTASYGPGQFKAAQVGLCPHSSL